jgi:3-dehydroquinate synthase
LEKIIINTPDSRSEITVGENWEAFKVLIPENGAVIVTDDNIKRLYGGSFPDVPTLVVSPGEESKRLEVIEDLAAGLLREGIDRNGFVVAIGGGVVCDLGGFLASVYMRGVRCGYVSTSLLSQVDASTGGKNGVNLGGTKNILGIIRQPEFVICDPEMLLTLSEEEYLSGLSELIKTAMIGNDELFNTIAANHNRVMQREKDLLTYLVAESVKFKASVVMEDEKEIGLRRILNFGHTFGHAIELQMSLKHGFAVASGMELAVELSLEKGFIGIEERDQMLELLLRYGLLNDYDIHPDIIRHLILQDKKKTGSEINFVFCEGIGKAVVKKVPVDDLIDFYKRFREKK